MATYKVRYKGLSDVREMSKSDLKAVGIDVPKGLRWERKNAFTETLSELPEGLEDALKAEGTFTIEEVGEDGSTNSTDVQGEAKDDTGSTVVDSTTGQKSSKK